MTVGEAMSPAVPLERIDFLHVGPADIIVFIDETGVEHYGDPHFPIFGFGGCATLGDQYHSIIRKPWRHLKWTKFGGANKPFHANELGRLRPGQIGSLNRFMLRPFHRLGVVSDDKSLRAESIDGHRSMAMSLHHYLEKTAAKFVIDRIAVVFEQSDRGTPLVYRDFQWLNRGFYDKRGKLLRADICFEPKASMEPGLELADLIAHTVGRQQRQWRRSPGQFEPDFRAVFHSVDRRFVEFVSVAETKLEEVNLPTSAVAQRDRRAIDLHATLALWAQKQSTIAALHLFGSRARGDFRPDSDVDLAFEFVGVDEDLAELISNAAKWKGELRTVTGLEVKDVYLRSDPEVSGPVLTVFRRQTAP
jgi:predicted nucleotidyltransferase